MDDRQNDVFIIGEEYEKNMDTKVRKDYGRFYTPEFIIDYIIKNTVANIDIVKNPFVKILDPSCGSGYFLIRIYDVLMNKFLQEIFLLKQKYSDDEFIICTENEEKKISGLEYWTRENLHYHIIKNCIFGSDIDNNAVKITKTNLSLKSKESLCIEPNIICCDSLIKYEEDYNWKNILKTGSETYSCEYVDVKGTLKKKELNHKERQELIKICEFWNEKYDYIIGNPPWVSLSRKHKGDIKDKLTSYYINKYDGNCYLPNLYEYFIKRSFEIVKDGGIIGFIIPDRFANNLQYKALREKILTNCNVLHLAFQIRFPNINTDTMIFVIEKNYNKDNKIRLHICSKRSYSITQKEYLKNLNYEFLYENNDLYKDMKSKIENESEYLGDISTTFTGFIGDSKKITKEKIKDSQVEILKGENINKFNILNKYYYEFLPENIKGGTKNLSKLKAPLKIIVRKTGNKIISALDTKGYIVEQSLYGIIDINNSYLYKYVLAVLNSKLMEWYYLNFLVTNLNSMPQIKKYNLNKMPIKKCSIDKQHNIEKMVDTIIVAKKYNDIEQAGELEKMLNDVIFDLYEINNCDRKTICGNK